MSHPQDLSLRAQAGAVASGELDPAELLAATLGRIEERDAALNAIVGRAGEEAERMLAEAPAGTPLHGVPVVVKDQYRLPWWGPREAGPRPRMAPGESGLYRRLRAGGAVVAGVANMHIYGAGTTGHHSAYGPAANPWDPTRCAGGSSSGSAAAVGGRLVAGAVGTDGGGSVRIPAAYCGVTGLKSTFGATPADGFTYGFASVGAAGPMCRDAADARLLGRVMLDRELPAGDARRLRVGLVRSPFWEDLDPAAEGAATALLGASGWATEELELPGAEHAMISAVLHVALEGLPGLRPDELAEADPLMRGLVKYQLLLPASALVRAGRIRAQLRRGLVAAFERCDVLAWPTVPTGAPALDNPTLELPSGPSPADPPNVRQCGVANLTGVPAISVPAGRGADGLPLALQLVGPWGEEAMLLDAAEHLEQATGREHVDAVPPIAAGAAA